MARAAAAHVMDVRAERVEQGSYLRQGGRVAADHQGQRPLLRAGGAAGDAGVQVTHAASLQLVVQVPGGGGVRGAKVHDDLAVAGVLEQPAGAPDHRLDHRAVRQREHDHVAAFGQLGQAVGFGGAAGGDPGRVGVDGEHGVPGVDHPAGDPADHVAGAHHPDRLLPRGRLLLRCHPHAPLRSDQGRRADRAGRRTGGWA